MSDINETAIPITTASPGTITIQSSSVPEPSSLFLVLGGVAALVVRRRLA